MTWRLCTPRSPLQPAERQVVVEALEFFEGARYRLVAYVVMDDHVHVIVQPVTHDLPRILHSWKSFTANRLQRLFGRQRAVWQDESFDRIIRDAPELEEKIAYVIGNPARRWPEVGNQYPFVKVFPGRVAPASPPVEHR